MIDRAGAGEGRLDRDRIGGVHDHRSDIAERMARGFELRPVAAGDGRPVAKAREFGGGGETDSRRSADDEDVFGHGVLKLQLLQEKRSDPRGRRIGEADEIETQHAQLCARATS